MKSPLSDTPYAYERPRKARRWGSRRGAAFILAVIPLTTLAHACLITSPPQFSAPKHTAPFLIPSSATPALGNVVVIDNYDESVSTTGVLFAANFVSQDSDVETPDFHTVQGKLYLDYGYMQFSIRPYAQSSPATVADGGQTGSLDQTAPRTVSATLKPDQWGLSLGCHTVTLVVSHKYDDAYTGCPLCDDDFTTLTWQVLYCNSRRPDACTELDATTCPVFNESCPRARATYGMNAPCPETNGP